MATKTELAHADGYASALRDLRDRLLGDAIALKESWRKDAGSQWGWQFPGTMNQHYASKVEGLNRVFEHIEELHPSLETKLRVAEFMPNPACAEYIRTLAHCPESLHAGREDEATAEREHTAEAEP